MIPEFNTRRRLILLAGLLAGALFCLAALGLAAIARLLGGWPSGELLALLGGGYALLLVLAVWRLGAPFRPRRGSTLILTLEGALPEEQPGGLRLGRKPEPSLPELIDALAKAARDPRISDVLLRIGAIGCGWGKVDELRRGVAAVRAAGKPVTAYLSGGGMLPYLLATAADEIHVPPEAEVELLGLRIRPPFLAGLIETLGLEADVERIGEYKSMGDLLVRRSMSAAHREVTDALLDALIEQAVGWIADGRGLDREKVAALFDDPPLDAAALERHGLVDALRYEDQLIDLLAERKGDGEKLRQVALDRYAGRSARALGIDRGPLVLRIDAVGSIVQGRSRRSPLWGRSVGSDSLIERLRAARKQKKAKALLLRIDSPGGSGLASALIWREIRRTAEQMPVVASLSDVAGSGGYYLAMAADSIVAYPTTLTGSIGVVGARLSAGPLLGRLGIAFDGEQRGRYAGMADSDRRLDPEELARFQRKIRQFYDHFVSAVADCRGQSVEQADAVARGRVWTGAQAAEHQLVDRLGGVTEALAEIRRLADLPEDSPLRIREVSTSEGPLQALLGLLPGGGQALSEVTAAPFLPGEALAYAPELAVGS